MNTIRVGILGAGQISVGHCRSINQYPGARVVAVADPNGERARDLAGQFKIPQVMENPAELIADPEIDAVTIAVPNAFHASQAIAALETGKHVLLEKPFARNLEEALEVAAAAESSGKIFTVGMNFRFTPPTVAARKVVESGVLGEIHHINATLRRRQAIPKAGTWFGRKDLAGGGVLLDLGAHLMDAAFYISDHFDPVAVSGYTHQIFGQRGMGYGNWGLSTPSEELGFDVEDSAGALIRMRNGCTLRFEVSWALPQPEPVQTEVELLGSQGGLQVYSGKLSQPKNGGSPKDYDVSIVERPDEESLPDRFSNWLDAIQGGVPPCCTLAQALAVQKTLDAIYASAESGREVFLDDS